MNYKAPVQRQWNCEVTKLLYTMLACSHNLEIGDLTCAIDQAMDLLSDALSPSDIVSPDLLLEYRLKEMLSVCSVLGVLPDEKDAATFTVEDVLHKFLDSWYHVFCMMLTNYSGKKVAKYFLAQTPVTLQMDALGTRAPLIDVYQVVPSRHFVKALPAFLGHFVGTLHILGPGSDHFFIPALLSGIAPHLHLITRLIISQVPLHGTVVFSTFSSYIAHSTTLNELVLTQCQLDSQCTSYIAAALQTNTSLTSVNLGFNPIGVHIFFNSFFRHTRILERALLRKVLPKIIHYRPCYLNPVLLKKRVR